MSGVWPRKWRALVHIEAVGKYTLQISVPAFDPTLGGYIIPMPDGHTFEKGQNWLARGYVHQGLDTFDFEDWQPAPPMKTANS